MVESGRIPGSVYKTSVFEGAADIVEINIQKRSPQCLKCDELFRHDQKHYSLLKIDGKDFLREDYCEKCWREHSAEAGADQVYSYWETSFQDPAVARATPKEQFLPLLNLCYESIARGGPDAEAMAYMCALILRRQKVFRFVREEQEEQDGSPPRSILVFSDKHNDTQIRIVDPQLTESQLQDVRGRLEEQIKQVRGQADGE